MTSVTETKFQSESLSHGDGVEHRIGTLAFRTLRLAGLTVLYLAALWFFLEFLIWFFDLPTYLVPRPQLIVASLARLPSYYAEHAWVTFQEAALGALIGFSAGFCLGVFLRYGGWAARILNPVILASQVFPKEALAPLFLVFLGFGVLPKIVIAALISFFPVVINTAQGLRATPEALEKLMHVIGANEWERFWRCRLPCAAPYVLASLRVCATLSVIGAVVGEFVGSSAGLGHVIRSAGADVGTDRIYAALLLLGLLGASFYGIALFIETCLHRYSRQY
jgi:NitT/TauT family transport system permease protein